MNDQIFNTTNSDFISFLRVRKIPALKAERINFKQVAFFFSDKTGKISSLWQQWQMNPTKEMELIQNFVTEKDKTLKTVKIKLQDQYQNGGFRMNSPPARRLGVS